MTSQPDHFRTVSMMIADLQAEDREARLESMRGLLLIARTLGPERTRSELVPYVTEYLDIDDEVLRVLAQNLGRMLEAVGGPAHASTLLQALALLCPVDEITVRNEAIGAFNAIAEVLFAPGASADMQAQYCATIAELAAHEQSAARSCAAGLLAIPMRLGSAPQKRELRTLFTRLSEDTDAVVRRAVCVALASKPLAEAVHAIAPDALVGPLTKFAGDSAEGVKLQSIPAAVTLIALLGEAAFKCIRNLVSDNAWRVRFMLADKVGDICKALPPRDVPRLGLPLFRQLLTDSAQEIRGAAVFQLPAVLATLMADDNKKDATVASCRLSSDSTQLVRQCLAEVLLQAVPYTTKPVWDSTIIPACNALLQDDDPQVKLGLIRSFSTAATAIGGSATPSLDGLQSIAASLVPTVVALAQDPNWRVRELVLRQAPSIVQSLRARTLEDMLQVCVGALKDRVATIRQAATETLVRLAEKNPSFVRTHIFGQVQQLVAASTNYSHRVTWVLLIAGVPAVVEDRTITNEVVALLQRAATDRVANVRLCAARSLRALIEEKRITERDVDATVRQLKQDTDVDVADIFREQRVA
jgi:serine/threonine-protein phosphatase 2A regulatory subunit A